MRNLLLWIIKIFFEKRPTPPPPPAALPKIPVSANPVPVAVDSKASPGAAAPPSSGNLPEALGVKCISTIFGLNYNGSIDGGDNGQGAFTDLSTGKPYNTRNKSLVGVSIPIPFYHKTPNMSKLDLERGVVTATIRDSHGHLYQNIKVVDLGPGMGGDLIKSSDGPHLLDRTYGLCAEMNSFDNAAITFWLVREGKAIEVLGQDTPYKNV